MENLQKKLVEFGFDTTSLIFVGETGVGGVYQLRVKANEVFQLWQWLTSVSMETGFSPLIDGPFRDNPLTYHLIGDDFPGIEPEEPPEISFLYDFSGRITPQMLESAALCSAEEFFKGQGYSNLPNESEILEQADGCALLLEPDELTWRVAEKSEPDYSLLFFPTSHNWELPIYMHFGGWNYCPGPEVQVAIARKWNAEFGAVIYQMNGVSLGYFIATPPPKEKIVKLAVEQCLYCNDLLGSTLPYYTISELVAYLSVTHLWHFWWD